MTPEDFRAKAAEFRRQAQASRTPEVRRQLLLMADDWDQLATEAEDLARARAASRAPE